MSKKSAKISELIDPWRGRDLDACYLGYFDCFNRGLFYEAHEVLEELWFPERRGSNGAFYQGLIQLAGAFVHLQKNRPRPAASLFERARVNLRKYPDIHERLDVQGVLALIRDWVARLEAGQFKDNPLMSQAAPEMLLLSRHESAPKKS